MAKKTKKLYAYIDESGQNTKGLIFVVSVLILDQERESISKELEKIEFESKKKRFFVSYKNKTPVYRGE